MFFLFVKQYINYNYVFTMAFGCMAAPACVTLFKKTLYKENKTFKKYSKLESTYDSNI